jgi:hypothetical protein
MIKNRLCSILLATTLVVFLFAAQVFNANAEAAGYSVSTAKSSGISGHLTVSALAKDQGIISVTSVAWNIGPFASKNHVKYVTNHITTLNVDLKWSNPNANLKLYVYSPSSIQFGPWGDDADGRIDHEINMDINNPGGIEAGEWHYIVSNIGEVEGTGYTI